MKILSQIDKRLALKPIDKIRDFQRKIYRKAKQEPEFRFYTLYDKIHQTDFLHVAYNLVKVSKGCSGLDGVSFRDIEKDGLEAFISQLQTELRERIYRPSMVKRVLIPKANGKMRPLGIPTIRDRVVQMSCKLVIEPIFEADFEESSFGFRPKRSSQDAIKQIKSHLRSGHTQVYDADLSQYFDTIPHNKLLQLVGKRISDQKVLHLLKLWLKTPVSEDGKITGGKKNKVGTPQGGVISPLLANIYLNLLDKLVRSHKAFGGIEIVRYADDFVLMGKQVGASVLRNLRFLLDRMELCINEEKSKLLNSLHERFDFLGFSFRYDRSLYDKGGYYWNLLPSQQSMNNVRTKIKTLLVTNSHQRAEIVINQLNPLLRGWLNYFSIEGVSYTKLSCRQLKIYLRGSLYRHQKRKSQKYRYEYCQSTLRRWIKEHNLIDPEKYPIFNL